MSEKMIDLEDSNKRKINRLQNKVREAEELSLENIRQNGRLKENIADQKKEIISLKANIDNKEKKNNGLSTHNKLLITKIDSLTNENKKTKI